MSDNASFLRVTRLSAHVTQIAVPTPTLPPAFETNTYLIQEGTQAILVDAGSDDPMVLQGLINTIHELGVTQVTSLLATHYHRDHTQGLPTLQQAFQAPIYIHSADLAQGKQEMKQPNVDVRQIPTSLKVGAVEVVIEHHPGHTHGHLHILIPIDKVILVGDHLAGDGTVWIGPPDGHMSQYYEALDAISMSGCVIAGPGHGVALQPAAEAATTLKQRRQNREIEIVDWLQNRAETLDAIVSHLYGNRIPEQAMWVAKKTVQAHLIHLIETHHIKRSFAASEQFVYTSI